MHAAARVRSGSLPALVAMALAACAEPQTPPAVSPWYPAVDEQGNTLMAVYEGRIPCNQAAMKGCDKIKVALVLYHDRLTQAPATYKLARVHVAESPAGNRQVVSGRWHLTQGAKLDPAAQVYRLDGAAPEEFRAYWAIGHELLLMLDADLNPRVGTASWSYTLNRTR
jgi:hypothetical protein